MIRIICVGRVKEAYIREGVAEFEKRLTRYAKVEVLELKDSTPEKEAKEIIEKAKGTIYLLDETGIEYSSQSFALLLKKFERDVTFVIGGPNGLDDTLKQRNMKIALSKMTFTHEMARLFFIEQLYRGYCILNNIPYHK